MWNWISIWIVGNKKINIRVWKDDDKGTQW